MDTKGTLKITRKDLEKLNNEYAKGKVYIAGIVKEQQSIIELAETRMQEVNKRLEVLGKFLKTQVDISEAYSDGEIDLKGELALNEYSMLLVKRAELQKTVVVALESIERVKLNLI